MTVEEVKAHGKQYSQTYKKNYGLWVDNFHAMALKTTIKMLLKKFAPKSIENIAKAVESDQASFVGDIDNAQAVYVDNDKSSTNNVETTDFEEVDADIVDTETGEVVEPKAETPTDDDDF